MACPCVMAQAKGIAMESTAYVPQLLPVEIEVTIVMTKMSRQCVKESDVTRVIIQPSPCFGADQG